MYTLWDTKRGAISHFTKKPERKCANTSRGVYLINSNFQNWKDDKNKEVEE